MKALRALILMLLVGLGSSVPCLAQGEVDGVLGLTPVGEHSCFAARLEVPAGQSLAAIHWFHNDGSTPFPRLLLMEGQSMTPPDVSQTGLILQEITGESLAWGEIILDPPVSSGTGIVFAVFELPAYTELTGEGVDGGPGIGYSHAEDMGNGYISADGAAWVRIHPDYVLAVEGVTGLAKGVTGVPLKELALDVEEGWWSHVGDSDGEEPEEIVATEQVPLRASKERPLMVVPNPFNPRTQVYVYLEAAGPVTVDIYNVRGRRVKRLAGGSYGAGSQEFTWLGDDDRSMRVASGVYFVRAQTAAGTVQQRVALVR